MDWSLASPFPLSSYVSEIKFQSFYFKEIVDRDAGGSVVVKRQKMELMLSPLQSSSSLLRRNHQWRKSWVLLEKLTSGSFP